VHLIKTKAEESSYVTCCELLSNRAHVIVQLGVFEEEFVFVSIAKICAP
jgi:hypothetical protein